jgi:hypothetical protein
MSRRERAALFRPDGLADRPEGTAGRGWGSASGDVAAQRPYLFLIFENLHIFQQMRKVSFRINELVSQ